jgi:transcription elongation factor GreA
MTAGGYASLVEELKHLKTTERPAVILAIEEARAHGDLSENAEYHAAKDKQGFIEGRVGELKAKISLAEVIDPKSLTGSNVKFGATVCIADEDTDVESTYQIVGADESDIKAGLLSVSSPLARALIGKEVGDSISVDAPGGARGYEVVSVEFK